MWHLTKGYNPHVVPDQSSPKAQILNTKQQGPQQVKTNHTLQKKIQRIKTVPDRKRKMQVARVGQGEEVKVAPKKKKYKNTKAQNTKAQTKQWNLFLQNMWRLQHQVVSPNIATKYTRPT